VGLARLLPKHAFTLIPSVLLSALGPIFLWTSWLQNMGLGDVRMRKSISMLPSSMREWLALAGALVAIVAAYAGIAFGHAFKGFFFWGAWSAFVLLVAIYLFRRGALLRSGQASAFTLLDKILLACVHVSGFSAFVAIYLTLCSRR
jgi:hypothetical protein